MKCFACDGDGRVNHRCGMVCVDDECLVCHGTGSLGRRSRLWPAHEHPVNWLAITVAGSVAVPWSLIWLGHWLSGFIPG